MLWVAGPALGPNVHVCEVTLPQAISGSQMSEAVSDAGPALGLEPTLRDLHLSDLPPLTVEPGAPGALSVFPSGPLPETSPLARKPAGATPVPKLGRSSSSSAASSSRRSSAALQNRPVTFHNTVKSSGYGMVHPKQELGKRPQAPRKVKSEGPSMRARRGAGPAALAMRYPEDCGLISEAAGGSALPRAHAGAALRVGFSPDGMRLGSSGTDRAARAWRVPVTRAGAEGSSFVGHDAAVGSVVSWYCGSEVPGGDCRTFSCGALK